MHNFPLRGSSLNLSILNFLNIFFMEFEGGHLKEHVFLSRIAFCLVKKCGHIHEL